MMKKINILLAAVAFVAPAVCVSAADDTLQASQQEIAATAEKSAKELRKERLKDQLDNHFKFYGFIRNYFPFDTRESKSGNGDQFYFLPLDRSINALGDDINARPQFTSLAITSRVGVDVTGYRINTMDISAKVEADFNLGLQKTTTVSGAADRISGTAQLRLRQAFCVVKWNELGKKAKGYISVKVGQAWHPMAADLPDIYTLDSGSPFNPFSRTPQAIAEFGFNQNWSVSAGFIWQMQYQSVGPDGTTANYMKFAVTPETYIALNYKNGGFLGRVGVDILSIKPRNIAEATVMKDGQPVTTTVKVKDRISTASPYIYLQYTKNNFKVKAKSVYSSAGEHMWMMSGYAVTKKSEDNSLWEYAPLHSTSSWVTLSYGKKFCGSILLGYIKNLGTYKDVYNVNGVVDKKDIFFFSNGDPSIMQMYRIQPELTYNVGKFTFGIEYMMTAVQYGTEIKDGKNVAEYGLNGLSKTPTHWIVNHRIQPMVKFNF